MANGDHEPGTSKGESRRGLGHLFRPLYAPAGMTYAEARAKGALLESPTWWFRIYHRGKPLKWNTHETTPASAKRFRRRKLAELGAGRPAGPDVEKTTLRDIKAMLVDEYTVNGRRSLPRMQAAIQHVVDFFGADALVIDVTADRVTAYTRARLDAGAKPATVNRELAALKRALRLGERARKVAWLPHIALLEERNVRTGFFEPDQYHAVVSHLSDALKPVAEAAYITGWRVKSEILTRQWHHVDFDAGWLRLEPGETKNGEGRMFPLTPQLRATLDRQREHTRAVEHATERIIPHVFHRGGERIRSFRRAWLTACKQAGVPQRIPHDFRRTAVRNLERAGVPRSAAMKMVGHKTEAIYRRYAIADEAMLRDAGARLAALHGAESGQGQAKSGRVVEMPAKREAR